MESLLSWVIFMLACVNALGAWVVFPMRKQLVSIQAELAQLRVDIAGNYATREETLRTHTRIDEQRDRCDALRLQCRVK